MIKALSLIVLLFASINTKNEINSNYLNHIENGQFMVTNSTTIIQYKCTYGGKPLAIWGGKIDEEIDSSKTIKPIFVKEGYTASDLVVEEHIRGKDIEVGKAHILPRNPPNGGLTFSLSRDTPFYVSTVLFTTALSEFSEQIVSNYRIYTDNAQFGGIVPNQQHSFAAATGLFVYEETTSVTSHNYSWDQLTGWSNYFQTNVQDINFTISPRLVEKDEYEGKGFWVCGQDDAPSTASDFVSHLKEKMAYIEPNESIVLNSKLKKEMNNYDISFYLKGTSKNDRKGLGFLQ